MAVASHHLRATSAPRFSEALHPAAWLAWLVAVSAAAFLTSNPLYLSLGLLAATAVFLTTPPSGKKRMMLPVIVMGAGIGVLSIPLNVLTGSAGPTELFELPAWRSPTWFGSVVFGGAITGEALVTATTRALAIATLVVAAAAFNASVDHYRLVRLAPRSLVSVMLVLTVAVGVVPQAVEQGRRVAEARRLRGRHERGLRALPPVLLPVLAGALERSVQRAESMESRGFGAGASRSDWRSSLLGVVGVGLCAWGAFALYYYGGALPLVEIAVGVCLVALATLRPGGERAERLRADPLHIRDVALLAVSALVLLLVVSLRVAGAGGVGYLAYPELAAPEFSVSGAVAFMLVLAPALLAGQGER